MTKGSSNTEVRIFNQKRIVNLLFHNGPMTIKDLAARLDLSLPTISVILKNLALRGLVVRGEKQRNSEGRPPSHIMLAFDAKVSVGISVSSRHVRMALIDLGPNVIDKEKYVLPFEGTDKYWNQVRMLLDRFIAKNNLEPSRLLGVGLSVQVPIEDGEPKPASMSSMSREQWDFSKPRSSLPNLQFIRSDAKMASLAQIWGVGEDEDVVFLILANSIGGAIVSNRHIAQAESKNAEFGHMVIHDGGLECYCGKRGCLDAYCSVHALIKEAGVELDVFFAGLAIGNDKFAKIWDKYLYDLAIGIHNLRMAFDADIVLGGEMSTYLADYMDDLKHRLAERNPFKEGGNYLRLAGYGEYDSAIGAAMLHIDEFLSQ